MQTQHQQTWMDPMVNYLKNGVLYMSKNEAQSIHFRSVKYIFYDDKLYKRGLLAPLLRYVTNEEATYIMNEIHEGVCRNHAGGQTLAHKALRQGYYWPTMKKDAAEFVRRCDKCQRFSS